MKLKTGHVIHHLHGCSFGALGTHSRHVAGFPFVTALPFVADEHHRPVFLMSKLAEHTKNVVSDVRASFLVFKPNGDVLAGARLTLLGEVAPVVADENLVARYRRYQPEAADYLALGDFSFFRLEPRALRLIAGFGEMGWLEATSVLDADSLDLATEADMIRELAADQPPHVRILGIDRFGMDVEMKGQRERQRFPGA